MSWVYLMLAIIMEVIGTVCLKLSEGFTRIIPSLLIFICYVLSIILLTLALKKIEIGMSYAIWSGVGTALIAIIGFIWFKEPATAMKIFSIILIIIGVIGLHLGSVAAA